MKDFIKAFRSGIRFSGRLAKNFKSQLKWFWKFSVKNTKQIDAWGRGNALRPSATNALQAIFILFCIIIILPCILFWVILKSI